MKYLVTGGAGFIGRWVVKQLLDEGHQVVIIDNLSNGSMDNISGFKIKFFNIDIKNADKLSDVFENDSFDVCIHLASRINVQESLDNPELYFEDVVGSYNIINNCIKHNVKLIFISTCMVYDFTYSITERTRTNPLSPYPGYKRAIEEIIFSHSSVGLKFVVLRPFNTYGAYQKGSAEGGVVSRFITQKIKGENITVFGDGSQTRDLMYVEDCANFIVKASICEKCLSRVINAGSGQDISIKELAYKIADNKNKIKFIDHPHPDSEIWKLMCDNTYYIRKLIIVIIVEKN